MDGIKKMGPNELEGKVGRENGGGSDGDVKRRAASSTINGGDAWRGESVCVCLTDRRRAA